MRHAHMNSNGLLFSLLEKMPSEYPVSLIFKAENVTNFEHFTSIVTINW